MMTGLSSARAHSISSQLWIADRQMRRFLTSLYRLTTPSATTSSTRPPRPSAFIMMTSPCHPVISAHLRFISAYLPSSRRISDSSRRISDSSRRISRHLGISPVISAYLPSGKTRTSVRLTRGARRRRSDGLGDFFGEFGD